MTERKEERSIRGSKEKKCAQFCSLARALVLRGSPRISEGFYKDYTESFVKSDWFVGTGKRGI